MLLHSILDLRIFSGNMKQRNKQKSLVSMKVNDIDNGECMQEYKPVWPGGPNFSSISCAVFDCSINCSVTLFSVALFSRDCMILRSSSPTYRTPQSSQYFAEASQQTLHRRETIRLEQGQATGPARPARVARTPTVQVQNPYAHVSCLSPWLAPSTLVRPNLRSLP